MDFFDLLLKVRDSNNVDRHRLARTHVLCFDPGHTTGWAIFYDNELLDQGQIVTKSQSDVLENAGTLFDDYTPAIVVMEDYRVYKWRKDHHVGSEMLTTQIIGGLELLAVINQVTDIIKQPAHIAKGFCTDKKLKEWGYYKPGMKHARDAIRHGCYYHLFGSIRKQDKTGSIVG